MIGVVLTIPGDRWTIHSNNHVIKTWIEKLEFPNQILKILKIQNSLKLLKRLKIELPDLFKK